MSIEHNGDLRKKLKKVEDELKEIKSELANASVPDCVSAPFILFGTAAALILSSILVAIFKMDGLERLDFIGYLLPLLAGVIGALGIYQKSKAVPFFWCALAILTAGLCFYMASKGVGKDVLYMFISMVSIAYAALLICKNRKSNNKSCTDRVARFAYPIVMFVALFVFYHYLILVLNSAKEEHFFSVNVCQLKLNNPTTINIKDKIINVDPATITISTRDPASVLYRISHTPCSVISYSTK